MQNEHAIGFTVKQTRLALLVTSEHETVTVPCEMCWSGRRVWSGKADPVKFCAKLTPESPLGEMCCCEHENVTGLQAVYCLFTNFCLTFCTKEMMAVAQK